MYNRFLANLQEIICLEEASLSDPSGLSVVKWTCPFCVLTGVLQEL
ncbi:MAG: hypothetical protein WC656_04505 [Sulfurimonas sp.]